MSPDERLAAVAAAQHGAFTLSQAREAGFTRAMVRHRRDQRRWLDLHPGVMAIAGAPPSWQRSLSAAALARPAGLVSHESAARLLRARFVEWTDEPTISTPRGGRLLERVTMHRRTDLDRCGRELVSGFMTTDRATTLIDLAATTRPRRYERIVDDQLSSHRIAIAELVQRFDLMGVRGKPGIAQARAVIAARAGGLVVATSELEHLFRERIAPMLPVQPTYQFLPPWRTEGIGRVDVAFPAHRLLVELDGRRWHLRDEQWEIDHRRDQDALIHGWRTARYSFQQVRLESVRVAEHLACILVPGDRTAVR
jgi:hypothetical protein